MNMPGAWKNVRLIAMFTVVSVVAGCSDTLTGKVEPTYTSLWDNLFNGCGVNCHSPSASDGTEAGPDMSSKSAFYNNLVGKSVSVDYASWASVRTGNCNSAKFIAAGNANASTVAASLIQSVSDTLSANQSCVTAYSVHEADKVTLSDADLISALQDWINQGAAND